MSWTIVEHLGRRHRLAVVKTTQGTWVGWSGGSTLVAPPRQFTSEGFRANGVHAPMTGKVVEVRVSAGDVVRPNDLLVVMQAMKMEYRLTATRDATVLAVHTRVGDLVELGAVLVSLSAEAG